MTSVKRKRSRSRTSARAPEPTSVAESPLKTYAAEPFNIEGLEGSSSMLEVTCPSCKGSFWVALRWSQPFALDDGRAYWTRACPYCFRTAKVPKFT